MPAHGDRIDGAPARQAPIAGPIRPGPMVHITPRLTYCISPSTSLAAALSAARRDSSIRPRWVRIDCPSGVRETDLPSRRNSGPPSSASNCWIATVRAGYETAQASAAWVKFM
jgi:hypothetical protein